MSFFTLSLIAQFSAISGKDLCVDDRVYTCPGTSYACSCFSCDGCSTNGVACNCFNCGCYTRCSHLCGATMPECAYPLNTGSSNVGRCGPLYGNKRCNAAQASYALYCNEANGWCGDTSAHKGAQTSDAYDYDPASCQDSSGSSGSGDPDYECLSGYFEQSGDIPGWGSVNGVGSGRSVSSCDECGQLCSAYSGCNSFECSPSDLKCNLNSAANPSQGPYLDYVFCTKDTSGSDDPDDGGSGDPDYGYFSICVADVGDGQTNTDTIEARLTVRPTAGEFKTSEWKMLGALFGSSSLGTCVDIGVFAADYHLPCWDTLELYTCSSDGLAIDTIKYWDCSGWNYVEVPTFRENPNYPQYSPDDCIVSDYIWLDDRCYALRIDLSSGYVLMDPPITSGQNCQTYPAKSDGLSLIDEDDVITIRVNDKVMMFGGILVIFAVLSVCWSVYICLGDKHHKGYKSVRVFSDTEQEIVVK